MCVLASPFWLESPLEFHVWETLTTFMEYFFLQRTNLNDLEITCGDSSLLLMTEQRAFN